MLTEQDIEMTPAWIVRKMLPQLDRQSAASWKYEQYYDGNQPLAVKLATKRYREEFTDMLANVRDNWMPLVVDSTAERLHPTGWRFGNTTKADSAAQLIAQRNYLDADLPMAFGTALTTGRCPIMVWAGDDGKAEITIEHPSQVYVQYHGGSHRKRRFAVKRWRDDWTGEHFVNLMTPTRIVKFVTKTSGMGHGQLVRRENVGVGGEFPNPLGLVPVVELRNRMRHRDGLCRSELMEVLSTQDQIDKTLVDMLVASEFAAFKQRWATGVEIETDPETGRPKNMVQSIDRMMAAASDKAKFGTFEATDLEQYDKIIQGRIRSIASRTKTPPHYFMGTSSVMPSGESIKSAETGLVAKVRNRMTTFGETSEEVMRLAFLVEDDQARGREVSAETIWADPESRTEAEHVDATIKKRALSVPLQQLWEDLGYTQTQIGRFGQMLLDEALLKIAAGEPDPAARKSMVDQLDGIDETSGELDRELVDAI